MKPLSKPFHLAGVQYSDAGKLSIYYTQPPTLVDIRHNPDNPHDAFALECRINDTFIGHIPRAEQAAWFYYTSHNVNIICRLDTFDKTKPPYEQIKVQFVCDEKYITTVLKQNGVQI